MKGFFRGLGPNVTALGLASFFTDIASEMAFPLLPRFITGTLKADERMLGVVEGSANALSSLLRIASGWMSDRFRRRKIFIVVGYGIAAVARPFYALATSAWHVFGIRMTDRFGKGFRLAARDALIADSCEPWARGKAFGFQHALDNAGAALGGLLAGLLLWAGMTDRRIFLWTAIPAAAVMAVVVLRVRDVPAKSTAPAAPLRFRSLGRDFGWFLALATLFTLGNSSDIFILHRASQCGVGPAWIPVVWTALGLMRAAAAIPAGMLSDRIGRSRCIVAGWIVYALAYAGFAVAAGPLAFVLLVGLYGLYYALAESVLRAVVADLVPEDSRGTAYGMYHFCVGVAALPASLGFGWIYATWGAKAAFSSGAAIAVLSALLWMIARPGGRHSPQPVRPSV